MTALFYIYIYIQRHMVASPGTPAGPWQYTVCWAHGLLFVVGAMCSPVYWLPPPIFLTNHCFSCSTCVPHRYPRLSPYLASWCLQSCADPLSYIVCICLRVYMLFCVLWFTNRSVPCSLGHQHCVAVCGVPLCFIFSLFCLLAFFVVW